MPLDPGSLGGTVPQYVELIFDMYSVGPAVLHIDNVRLFNVPEPTSLVLIRTGACPGAASLVVRRRAVVDESADLFSCSRLEYQA